MTGRVCWGDGEGTPAKTPGQKGARFVGEAGRRLASLWDRGVGMIREVSGAGQCPWGLDVEGPHFTAEQWEAWSCLEKARIRLHVLFIKRTVASY